MDPALIVALSGVLTAVGTGAGWLISRADKRRERRESAVEALLKERVAALQSQLDDERRAHRLTKRAAGKWREQLIAHDINPDPAEWPEAEHG